MDIKGKKAGVIIIAAVLGVLILFSALIGFLYLRDNGKICNGVTISYQDFSGLNKQEFEQKASQLSKSITEKKLVFDFGSMGKHEVLISDLGFSMDTEALYKTAYEQGRDGNFFSNTLFKLKALFGTKTLLDFPFYLDQSACDEEVKKVIEEAGGQVREHEVVIEENIVKIVPGKSGYTVTNDYFKDSTDAIVNGAYQVTMKLEKQAPAEIVMAQLVTQVNSDPVNAEYKIENQRLVFVNEIIGRKLDEVSAEKKLANLVENGSEIFLDIIPVQPELTVEKLKAKLFDSTLAETSSWYNRGLVNRSINVELATKFINGVVLAPGEVFSYNDVVGERTVERGFKNAQIYVQSKVVEGLGGGICQVSSTLYNTVLSANLEVVERKPHSLPVTYVPLGQDATVAFGYIDFKFKNDRDYPIEIEAWCEKGNVHVRIKGTDDGIKREVKVTNVTTEVLHFTEEVIEDKTLKPGERKVVAKGQNGYIVKTYKKVYENGVLVADEFLYTSKYNPQKQQVKVNTATEETVAPVTPEPEKTNPSVTPGGENGQNNQTSPNNSDNPTGAVTETDGTVTPSPEPSLEVPDGENEDDAVSEPEGRPDILPPLE